MNRIITLIKVSIILTYVLCGCSVRYTTGNVKKVENNLIFVNGEWFEILDTMPSINQEVKIYYTRNRKKVNSKRL